MEKSIVKHFSNIFKEDSRIIYKALEKYKPLSKYDLLNDPIIGIILPHFITIVKKEDEKEKLASYFAEIAEVRNDLHIDEAIIRYLTEHNKDDSDWSVLTTSDKKIIAKRLKNDEIKRFTESEII